MRDETPLSCTQKTHLDFRVYTFGHRHYHDNVEGGLLELFR